VHFLWLTVYYGYQACSIHGGVHITARLCVHLRLTQIACYPRCIDIGPTHVEYASLKTVTCFMIGAQWKNSVCFI